MGWCFKLVKPKIYHSLHIILKLIILYLSFKYIYYINGKFINVYFLHTNLLIEIVYYL